MSGLLLVRHGQASFLSDDYDRLSRLGERQSRLLGSYWAEQGVLFDRVFVGPRRRHCQTHEAVAAVYKERGIPWPDPVTLTELDEYPAEIVFKAILPKLNDHDSNHSDGAPREVDSNDGRLSTRRFRAMFETAMRLWVRGEAKVAEVESWREFRRRVDAGVAKMISAIGLGQTAVAFTSGGPVAATSAFAMGINDEGTLELSWQIRNAAYAEFNLSGQRLRLSAFNTTSHLIDPTDLTYL
ncbi:MAG: histidine phosphatase family protein [Acidobacteria bacterium]|nr:histidine phosphatase family protein [Acidobacteriota bacterium]MBI3658280.1 histidine phosphatase family protein [Acidobacteriota bacterium]